MGKDDRPLPHDIASFGKPRPTAQDARNLIPGQSPAADKAVSVSIQAPEVVSIPSAQDFLVQLKTAALANVIGTTVDTAELRLNAGEYGVVKVVEIFVNAPTTAINVNWALLVNDAPVPGFDNLSTFPRAAANLSIAFTGTVRLPPSARVRVRITNLAATGPWDVGAAFAGWKWNAQQGERYTGLPFLYVR